MNADKTKAFKMAFGGGDETNSSSHRGSAVGGDWARSEITLLERTTEISDEISKGD
jgi:hypothetical protein